MIAILALLLEKFGVGFGDFLGGARDGDFALLEHDGAVAELKDVFHGVSDEDDGLFAMERGKIIVAFFLESGIADGKDFVENEDVALGTDGDGESETDLHAGRVIFEFLIHEFFEFGKFYDVIIHGGDFGIAETKHGAVEIDIFAAGEFHVETDAEFDEGDEVTVDDHLTGARIIDASEDLEEGGLARAVATDDADKFAFFDVETDVVEDLLIAVAFDAAETVEDGLFETPRTFGGEAEGFGEVTDRDGDRIIGVVSLNTSADNTSSHLDFLREEARFAPEN